MRKSKTMRAAILLLALTLLTSCFVGGTFAKYTTSASGTDKARVAYWGFQNAAVLDFDLFDGEYDNTVDSQNSDNVVAPGTTKIETFTFKYVDNTKATAPEVDYTFEIAFKAEGTYTNLDANKNFVWKLTLPGGEEKSYQTVAELETAIEALNNTYNAGALPTGFDAGDNTITIGWEWRFETTGEDDVADATQDATDTAMGNMAILENVIFTITITATQAD